MARYTSFRGKGLVFLAFLWFVWFMNFSVRSVFSPIMPLIEDEYLISHALASSLFIEAWQQVSVTLGVIFGIGVVPFLLGVAGDTTTFRLGILLFGIVVTLASGLIFLIKDLR